MILVQLGGNLEQSAHGKSPVTYRRIALLDLVDK